MIRIDHRESHDIDIFLSDPQFIPLLNPESQGYKVSRLPDSYDTDGSRVLKLAYEGIGEIDFICCDSILDNPSEIREVLEQKVKLETSAEIIAKKVSYRGARLQPRDMFDLAAVVEHYGTDYLVDALRQCGEDACTAALTAVEKTKPEFIEKIIGQLMYRDANKHLVAQARDISLRTLRSALSA